MKVEPYRNSRGEPRDVVPTRQLVEDALAKQAARRPRQTPPREMPITPTLPRVPKPHKKRKYSK